MDIRTMKISNRLIGFGLCFGYMYNIVQYGWYGSIYFLIRISLPVLVFYLLFLMRALGAGDIKLFSVISSCVGLEHLTKIVVYSFLLGALLSALVLICNRNLYSRLFYLSGYIRTALLTKSITKYDHRSDGKQNYIHFSVPILVGYVMYLGGM
ncbi:MAG: A24 family peptidase [Eubacterium sp.]|nr:A24 family peptidase [Eubacterium sp.]